MSDQGRSEDDAPLGESAGATPLDRRIRHHWRHTMAMADNRSTHFTKRIEPFLLSNGGGLHMAVVHSGLIRKSEQLGLNASDKGIVVPPRQVGATD